MPTRLAAIAARVPQDARFADIGTDHAYLPIWLIRHRIIASAIASDLREGPLRRGEEVAKMWSVSNAISFRLCDGLDGIPADAVDTIAIAGMGGDTIASILKAAPWSNEEGRLFLLQPMSAIPELRLWLSQNGFSIDCETVVQENRKLYVVLTVRPGVMPPLTAAELWVGKQKKNLDMGLRTEFLNLMIARRHAALRGLEHAATDHTTQISELRSLIKNLMEIKEEWLSWQL
ncbi:MAG: class I SAM-dependent methyltransferase [Evtepia sp.]